MVKRAIRADQPVEDLVMSAKTEELIPCEMDLNKARKLVGTTGPVCAESIYQSTQRILGGIPTFAIRLHDANARRVCELRRLGLWTFRHCPPVKQLREQPGAL